jgi:general secretion pathway protein M
MTTARPTEAGSIVAAGSRVGAAGALAPLRARWEGLAGRERMALGAGAFAIGLAAVWMLAVQPAWRTLREAPPQRAKLDAQWQAMQRLAAEAAELRGAAPLAPALAVQALQAATGRLGAGARLTLQGERAVVALQDVDGETLQRWLAEVRRGARAQPVELRLTRDGRGWRGSVVLALGGGG